ncbi:hypothetical protein NQ318_003798 [Aromia moschata]|uniref:D-3-phosphoglycerate dehydrogenase n=1 Tax=Aromia moschata TaxID=1265417 RepID=A0AAV8YKE2_9CUCU|nr:hypothetical protein NQ318_003798 [Aromia moschata]
MMDIKKVLVADAVDASCVQLLKNNGIDVDCKYKLPKEQLIAEIPKYDGLIVRSDTKVAADVIAGNNLKVVGRAGAGVDNIDINTATAKNILVLNTPGGNAISACELTCSLITSLARNVVPAAASLKAGRWDRKLYSAMSCMAKRLPSWVWTIGYDPIVSPEESKKFNVESLTLDQIWPLADYITVHTPLIPETRNLICEAALNKCKKGVCIVNVARGGIVNESDLLKAIKSGQCGGAALDVFEQEPPTDSVTLELINNDKVIATPHLGASTTEAQIRVAVEIAEQFIALTGKNNEYTTTPGVVNRSVLQKLKM